MQYNPFNDLASEYEAWFIENKTIFKTELLALKQVIPSEKKGIEIGIGSGIFAEKLGIRSGIDPSQSMLELAKKRGLEVLQGYAEELPYTDASFDYAVFITSLCFIGQPEKALSEASRILKKEGSVIVAIIDRDTTFGKFLYRNKDKSRFYKHAHFFSTQEMIQLMEQAGFRIVKTIQTLKDPANPFIEKPEEGFGTGSFVVIQGVPA